MKIIKKVILNVDYKQRKKCEIITFSNNRIEQREAFQIINSGIGKVYEEDFNATRSNN
jgi:hypothetical protein